MMNDARSFKKQAGCDLFSWSWLQQQVVLFFRWKKIPAGLLDSTEGRDHRTLTLKITCSCLNGVDEDLTNLAKSIQSSTHLVLNNFGQLLRRILDCLLTATIFEELARMGFDLEKAKDDQQKRLCLKKRIRSWKKKCPTPIDALQRGEMETLTFRDFAALINQNCGSFVDLFLDGFGSRIDDEIMARFGDYYEES
ncbi:hypothetical protein Tco_1474208 [Tanacetum coccineum]